MYDNDLKISHITNTFCCFFTMMNLARTSLVARTPITRGMRRSFTTNSTASKRSIKPWLLGGYLTGTVAMGALCSYYSVTEYKKQVAELKHKHPAMDIDSITAPNVPKMIATSALLVATSALLAFTWPLSVPMAVAFEYIGETPSKE